jgi:hypothetical protein
LMPAKHMYALRYKGFRTPPHSSVVGYGLPSEELRAGGGRQLRLPRLVLIGRGWVAPVVENTTDCSLRLEK